MKISTLVSILIMFLHNHIAYSQELGLNEFIAQATKQNSRSNSLQDFSISAELSLARADIITSIKAFSLINVENDRKQPQFAAFEGVSRDRRQFQLGVEQLSNFGVTHRLYTNYSYINQKGATLIPQPEVSNSALIYEFSVPLLKNFLGKSVQFQKDIIRKQSESQKYTQSFEYKRIKAQAVSSYWRLKTSQQLVKSQEEILDQGSKFLDWVKSRSKLRLSEDSDLKQAEAIVKLRSFDLQREKIELIKATQAFNSIREVPLDTPVGMLQDFPNDSEIPPVPTEKDAIERLDLKALEAELNSQNSEFQLASENSKMELNLVGSAATNGLSRNTDPEYSKVFSGKYPAYSVGLRLSVPLDRDSVNDIQRSASLKKRGLSYALQRNKFDALASLKQLRTDYEQLQIQLYSAKDLLSAQENKYKTEKNRHKFGRTSTFQLLTFEQDYQVARQQLIRTKGLLWQLSGENVLYSIAD